jgi:dephospho-CoA kinase
MKPKIIGLTGPIASGKSSVAKVLRRRGAYVIDVDEIGHLLLTPQSDVWRELVKTFGSKILMAGGKVNKRKLSQIVFSNSKLLKKLNSIMHPRMRREILSEVRGARREKYKLIVINAAVLKEIGLTPFVDEVWVVLSSKKKRLSRLLKLGFSKEEALKRIKAQMADRGYRKIADKVIENNGAKKQLYLHIRDLA